MSNKPQPSPEPAGIETFVSSVWSLLRLLFARQSPLALVLLHFQARLEIIQDRIADLAARFEAGTLRTRRPASPRSQPARCNPVKPRDVGRLSLESGWLAKYLGQHVVSDHGTLLDVIQTAEMQALMAAAPQVADLFREMLRACGLLDEARPFLPPYRSQRQSECLAAAASAERTTAGPSTRATCVRSPPLLAGSSCKADRGGAVGDAGRISARLQLRDSESTSRPNPATRRRSTRAVRHIFVPPTSARPEGIFKSRKGGQALLRRFRSG